MVLTNSPTNKERKFYNAAVQAISRRGGDYATKFGALCAYFVEMGSPVKIQTENWMDKLFGFRSQNIYVSDRAVFLNTYGTSL